LITISHDHADGTVLIGSRKGDGVYDIARRHGFRHSRQAGIYLPGSRDRDPRRHIIEACAESLRGNGFEVNVLIDDTWRPAAVREAAREQRADERFERLDGAATAAASRRDSYQAAGDRVFAGIGGEPMKPDHYNYRRDLATREKGWASLERASDAGKQAVQLSRRAEAVRDHAAAKEDPRAIMRRVERLETEKRGVERELADAVKVGSAQSYLDRCRRNIDRLAEDIAHQKSKLAAHADSGEFIAWSPDNLVAGDRVKVRFHGWFPVKRVNRRSVSLDSHAYPTNAKFDQILGRRRGQWQVDTPNGRAWLVKTAQAVAKWQGLERQSTSDSCDPGVGDRVRAAIRLVHGLDLDAADAQVTAFRPTGSDDAAVDARRRLMTAYVTVYDRLTAGETVGHVQGCLEPDIAEPLWHMPTGEPQDVRVDRVKPGDVVKGVWDNSYQGRVLRSAFCGPVASVSQVRSVDHRDWVTVTLADGTSRDFRTSLWFAAFPFPAQT
jgi:uncharacterized protein (UPF0335 family)